MASLGLSVQSSVLALLVVSAAWVAHAGSITTNDPPVATLADGRTGTIAFEALTPKNSRDFVKRKTTEKSVIAGVLTLPETARTAGAPDVKVPAMVVVHGSSGVLQNDWDWARIGVIGFSRGGSAAINTALEPMRLAVINDDLRFAAHVSLYPGCGVPFVSAHLDGSPILMLLGGKDNYTPASNCLAYADELRARGASIPVVVYPNANHGFNSDAPPHFRPQPTTIHDCHGEIDLDNGVFTVQTRDQTVRGAAAVAELRRCTERGVTVGGDPEAREKAPGDIANFLKPIFELAR